LLAAAYADRFVRLMDVTALRFVFAFRCDGHQIGFDAGGARLGPVLRGSEFGWLDIQRPSEFHEFNTGNTDVELAGCQFSPDGRLLVCGTLTNVLFCDAATGAPLLQRRGFRLPAFAFDPRGEALFAAGTPGMHRWTMRWREPTWLEMTDGEILFPGAGWRAFTFSARGDWFAAANVRSNAAYLFDRSLTNRIAEAGPHPGADAVAVSPNGRWLATGSSTDRQVKVWAAGSDRERLALAVGPAPQPIFSADGKWLAAFGNSFHLYATGSWQPAPPLPIPEGAPVLGAAAFSPDGRVLAVICDLYTIRLFDLLTWQPLGLLRPAGPVKITGLAFSPDGARLAAAGDIARLRVWDLHDIRQRLAEFGLDWDLPPLPPAEATNARTLRVTFVR
jgi:WD40 repeat protein